MEQVSDNKVISISDALQPASDSVINVQGTLTELFNKLPNTEQFEEIRSVLSEQIDALDDIYGIVMGVQIATLG